MSDTWKVVAIVFIILFVIENAFVAYSYQQQTEYTKNSNKCSLETCTGYDQFYFDEASSTCYCYTGDKVAKKEVFT